MEIENLDSKKTQKRIAEIKPEIMELDTKSLKKLYVDTLIKMHCIANEMGNRHMNLLKGTSEGSCFCLMFERRKNY